MAHRIIVLQSNGPDIVEEFQGEGAALRLGELFVQYPDCRALSGQMDDVTIFTIIPSDHPLHG